MSLKEIKEAYFYAGDCANSGEEQVAILEKALVAAIKIIEEGDDPLVHKVVVPEDGDLKKFIEKE